MLTDWFCVAKLGIVDAYALRTGQVGNIYPITNNSSRFREKEFHSIIHTGMLARTCINMRMNGCPCARERESSFNIDFPLSVRIPHDLSVNFHKKKKSYHVLIKFVWNSNEN